MAHGAEIGGGNLWWAGLAALGLTVGIIGGMFGVGGNFLLTPLLNVVFGIPMEIAAGTGLCQMIGTAIAALRRHQKLRQGEIKIDWLMMAGSLLGVQAGAQAVTVLSGRGSMPFLGHTVPVIKVWLSLTYIVMLTSIAIWMLYDALTRPTGVVPPPGPLTRLRIPPYTDLPRCNRRLSVFVMPYIGLALGFLSGLLGIGGGVPLIPILVYGIGMRIQMAAGTGILMLVVTSIAGTFAHARLGHVHLGIAMTLLAGSTLGAPVGATLTSQIKGQRLRAIFAGLIMVTVVALVWNLFRAG